MKKIDSLINDKVKFLVRLHETKERDSNKSFLVEGLRACRTFIESKMELLQVYVTHELLMEAQVLCSDEKITVVSSKVMEKISQAYTASGIIAQFKMPARIDPKLLDSGLVLAQIQDPGNMGTLIRTAAALNIKSVVLVEGCDPWSYKVIQASAGALAHVNIFRMSWKELLTNKKDLDLVALVVSNGESINNIDAKKSLIVVGNEANGLPLEWEEQCDKRVTLDMPNKNIESLNAAIAGSIALYCAHNLQN